MKYWNNLSDDAKTYTIIGIVLVLIITLIFLCCSGSLYPVKIDKFEWTRSIEIEKFKVVNTGNWLGLEPKDSYDKTTRRKIRRYEQVYDGTESVAVRKSRYVNGQTEYYTDYETRTKYRDEPVYDIWVDYKINRWRHDRDVPISAYNQKPLWPEVNTNSSYPPNIGDTREGKRKEQYIVHMSDDKEYYSSVDFGMWKDLSIGQTVYIKVNFFGYMIDGPFTLESIQ